MVFRRGEDVQGWSGNQCPLGVISNLERIPYEAHISPDSQGSGTCFVQLLIEEGLTPYS